MSRVLFDLASYARSMENQTSVPLPPPSPEPEEIVLSNHSELRVEERYGDDPDPATDDDDDEISPNDSLQYARFHGQFSTVDLIKSAISIKKNYTGAEFEGKRDRPEYWEVLPWQELLRFEPPPLEFPPNDLLLSLVDLYFQNVNFITPFLHRPTFERLISQNIHKYQYDFGALLMAVCAMGSRYSNDPRVFIDGSRSELSAGWKFIKQIRIFRTSFEEPVSLHELQLFCVCSIFLRGTSLSEATGPLIALGIRLAQEVGAHKSCCNPGQTRVEQELWKRIYWQLVNIDVQASVILGRPPAQVMEDHDLELPIDCDDEYWEHPDPKQAFRQPEGEPSTVTAWILLLKLIDIFAVARRLLYTINNKKSNEASEEEKHVRQLDSALEKWLKSFPDFLHWDPRKPKSVFQDQSATLFMLYVWVQMQIHRIFVSRNTATSRSSSSLSLSSLARSASVARACCQFMTVHRARAPLPLPHVQLAVFQSGVILMIHAWAAKRFNIATNYEDDIRDVERCSEVLKVFEQRLV
ncbi:hypothetical protein K435DRAFT_753804 [Dendrothele bispora CBS 962.96]|uniref:Xylanolytic transcriptional activator regulatory domain-containing protein n=1 Tax=Dendrothele bispora (strain CBS 962.96) TaxID=1314807 RepID=A0A4S8M6A2_DENBC|nr:hypothetical protein K435DRAFT_753804 [Dendrothele bispora CBS 962.96]